MAAACAQSGGSMAAVIGLDEASLRQACLSASRPGSPVELANLNAPGQLIVSGARDAIDRLADAARAAGARRVLPLNVGGPFHSTAMRPAAEPLAQALAEVALRPARVPVVLNASAEASTEPDRLRDELRVQVYSPVRWIDCLERLAALGCDSFLEVGPGTVLTGLVKRTLPGVRTGNFGSRADLGAVHTFLSAASPA
jgi:[acyl-carrier-protein] S-malonyltransferase